MKTMAAVVKTSPCSRRVGLAMKTGGKRCWWEVVIVKKWAVAGKMGDGDEKTSPNDVNRRLGSL